MSAVIYIHRPLENQLGGIWGNIATIAGSVAGKTAQTAGLPNWAAGAIGFGGDIFAGLINRPAQSNCLTGRVSGNEAMGKCVAYIMQQLDEAAAAIAQANAEQRAQILSVAQQLTAALSDDRIFDQQIGGDSRKIREAAKIAAAEKLNLITQGIAASAGGTPAIDPATGQVGTMRTSPDTVAGIPLTTVLLLGAAGLGLVWFLK